MARTTAIDPANTASATAPTGTTAPVAQADGVTGTALVGQQSAGAAPSTTGTDGAAATITTSKNPSSGVQADTDIAVDEKGELMIYPLRSYLDGKEVRRAGGSGYKSPKHDAVSLIAAGLATDKKPKA
ncbi:hypothetical protein [Pseudomonas sp. DSP3-2-2]|uniref:hypothetical protein n=1 Tax=unclassified Pseudomonas TaxID=196821 RepID=UPI003CE6761E